MSLCRSPVISPSCFMASQCFLLASWSQLINFTGLALGLLWHLRILLTVGWNFVAVWCIYVNSSWHLMWSVKANWPTAWICDRTSIITKAKIVINPSANVTWCLTSNLLISLYNNELELWSLFKSVKKYSNSNPPYSCTSFWYCNNIYHYINININININIKATIVMVDYSLSALWHKYY